VAAKARTAEYCFRTSNNPHDNTTMWLYAGTGARPVPIANPSALGSRFPETKLWISDYGYDETLHGFDKSACERGRLPFSISTTKPGASIRVGSAAVAGA
jgi:hypothetical protein